MADYVPVRDHTAKYAIRRFKITVGPWKTFTTQYDGEFSHRVLGTLEVDVSTPSTLRTLEFLTVVQREERNSSTPTHSIYKSDILIGNLVNAEHERETFLATPSLHEGLWCSSCFADSMYADQTGGVKIPFHFIGRYFGSLQAMEPCTTCGKKLREFEAGTVRPDTETHVFSTVCNAKLQADVEARLASMGITSACQGRYDEEMPKELLHDITAGAMAPARVSAILEAHGFEGLDNTFGV